MPDALSSEFVTLQLAVAGRHSLEKEIDLAVEANREVEAVLRARPAAP